MLSATSACQKTPVSSARKYRTPVRRRSPTPSPLVKSAERGQGTAPAALADRPGATETKSAAASADESRTSSSDAAPTHPAPTAATSTWHKPQQQASRARQLAAAGVLLSGVGWASYSLFSAQPDLPAVQDVVVPVAAAAVGVPALGLAAGKAVLGDLLHIELHRGRLYVIAGVPSNGPPLQPGAVVVRPTGDVRGNGAYAAVRIPRGTYLGDYTGELLDGAAFAARYPDGKGDFAAAIDDEWTIDAVGAVADISNFHPVHMNHSRGRANVRRYYARAQRRISFFAMRDVQAGEELLYDYGRRYWWGREHEELP